MTELNEEEYISQEEENFDNSEPINNTKEEIVEEEKSSIKDKIISAKNFSSTVKTAAIQVKGFFLNTLLPLLGNPITWIVIGVIILVILLIITIMALTTVVGKNENANGCYGIGTTTGVTVTNTEDITQNSNAIAGWLMSTNFEFLGNKPMTLNQAAGIIGNWGQESGVNPKSTQSNWISSDTSNDDMIRQGSGGGKAIGLAQWDSGRRINLINFAKEKRKHWSDFQVQLEYFKSELEGGEGKNLVSAGFTESSKSPKELTEIFEKSFERAGIPAMENRYKQTEEFLKNYNGGYTSNTGGSCLTGDLGGIDTSDAVSLAISMAWENSSLAVMKPGMSEEAVAKPEYVTAKKKIMSELGGAYMPGVYADCGAFVSTIVKNTMDKDFPWLGTEVQLEYMKNSPKWQIYYKKSEAKPGDVFITTTKRHVMFYVGNLNGRDTIAEASLGTHVGYLSSNPMTEDMIGYEGYQYYGFRYIGG